MSLQFIKASTSDALTLTGISKRAFDSDVLIGGPTSGGHPGYKSVPFYTKMASIILKKVKKIFLLKLKKLLAE